MEKTVSTLDWRPIATAPADADLELSVYDNSEYHALVFPCRRDGSGWRDVGANRPMPLRPTHWRRWDRNLPVKMGENHMSKKAAEHHKKASEHLTHAARHHGEAAKHHEAGSHEKAAHHAHVARGHVIHGRGYAEEAVKAHLEEHGKK